MTDLETRLRASLFRVAENTTIPDLDTAAATERSMDADGIAASASRRPVGFFPSALPRPKRRGHIAVLAVAVSALAVMVSFAVFHREIGGSVPTSEAHQPGPAGPGCGGPILSLVVPPPDGPVEDIPNIQATRGQPITLIAQIQPNSSVWIVRAQTVIAVPGTDFGDEQSQQTQNQVAVSDVDANMVANNQELKITWTPQAQGIFPFITSMRFTQAMDCTSAPPSQIPPEGSSVAESELATVTVR